MNKARPGDIFTIEINRVFKDETGKTLYGVMGFNSLVFDDVGIGKLKSMEKKYEKQEVRVGDILQDKASGTTYIVTNISEGEHGASCSIISSNGSGGVIDADCVFDVFKKIDSNPEMVKLFLNHIGKQTIEI